MSMLADTMSPEGAVTSCAPLHLPDPSSGLVETLRDQFVAMPGLSLTLAQAARVLGADLRQSKRLLKRLLDEGFLVCDARGAFRRRDLAGAVTGTARRRPRHTSADAGRAEGDARPAALTPAAPEGNLLDAMGVELPCLACDGSYRVSLRTIRASQSMMDGQCPVRHFSDCPPAAYAHLIDPALLAAFEDVAEKIEVAAEGAGGRLVGLA